MLCSEVMNIYDEYLDGELDAEQAHAVDRHADTCNACRQALQERLQLRAELAGLPVEGPSEDFFDTALERATRRTDGRGKPWFARIGGAMAAVFAFLFITGVLVQPANLTSSSEIPEVTIALHEVTPVNLMFSSEVALQDARVSLQLPEGVQLAGFGRRDKYSWTTDLKEGNNILQLPLVGHLALSDKLVATLEHAGGSKTFELQVTVI